MSEREGESEDLRRRAEDRLAGRRVTPRAPGAPSDPGLGARGILHELEVHQVELELQKEELRAVRAELEATVSRYAELFDHAPIGYFAVAASGTIRQVNFAGARLVGRERARVLGRPFVGFVAEPDCDAFARFLAGVFAAEADEASRTCELTLARPDPSPVQVRLTASLADGPAPDALLAVEDITARRQAEGALEEASRRKDDFLAALSHELRNPLAPIRSGLALLARVPERSEQTRRIRAVIERQVGHLSQLVDDLLDVTRLARGKVRLRRERAELGEIVARTTEDHRAAFDANGVALQLHLASEPCWGDVDVTRVAQVVGNLLTNAAKFTARGGRVDVSVACDGAAAVVTVRDTGVGIAPEIRGRLFEPFSQAPQTLDRTGGGLGLGLATVKGLVELHGGSVGLRSDGPGHGAEFTVRLPLAGAPSERAGEPRHAASRHLRVLVIDDNEDAAGTLEEVLEMSGHEVRVAHDGPSGIALARALRPEVVICDIGLPGMDGYAVARALRSADETRRTFLVALSGYAQPGDVARAREAGFDRHVAKPAMLETFERLFEERSRGTKA